MHGPINVRSPNNISEWQMGFNSAFKWLICYELSGFISRIPLPLGFRELSRTKLFTLDFPKVSVIITATKELALFVT